MWKRNEISTNQRPQYLSNEKAWNGTEIYIRGMGECIVPIISKKDGMSEFSQESIQIFQHLNTDSFKVKLELDNAWILQAEVTH